MRRPVRSSSPTAAPAGRRPRTRSRPSRARRELGADGVELDVHRTADGVLVVHHDAAVAGVGLLADAPVRRDPRPRCPTVPTLAEALDACAGLLVNVEIKCLPVGGRRRPRARRRRGASSTSSASADRDDVRRLVVRPRDRRPRSARYAPELATGFLVARLGPRRSRRCARARARPRVAAPRRRAALGATVAGAVAAARTTLGLRGQRVDRQRPRRDRARSPRAGVDAIITERPRRRAGTRSVRE